MGDVDSEISRGFLFQVSSITYVEALEVAAWQIGRFHDEPILVAATPRCKKMIDDLGMEGVSTYEIEVPIVYGGHPAKNHRIQKLQVCADSPFDQTIFFDADTLILDSFAPIWTSELRICQIKERIDKKTGKPKVNTGMISFGKDREIFIKARECAMKCQLDDQQAFNRVYDHSKVTILPDIWNAAVDRESRETQVKMIHFIGRAWGRSRVWNETKELMREANQRVIH